MSRSVIFEAQDQPLREDVSLLGRLVGEMLSDQLGTSFFELLEEVRRCAIARREGEPQRLRDLSALLGDLPVERALDLVRAFSSYFPCEDLDTHFSQRGSARCRASLRDTGDKRQICAPLQIWTPSFSRTMRVLEKLVSLPENLRNWTVWSSSGHPIFGHFRRCNLELQGGEQVPRAVST